MNITDRCQQVSRYCDWTLFLEPNADQILVISYENLKQHCNDVEKLIRGCKLMFYDVDYLLCPLPSLWRTVEFLKPWSIGYCVIRPNFCSTLLTSMSGGDLNMFLGDFLGGLFGGFGWSGSCLHRFYICWHGLREQAPGLLESKNIPVLK